MAFVENLKSNNTKNVLCNYRNLEIRIQIQKPFHLIVEGYYGRSRSYLSNAILWLERPKKDRPKVQDPKYSIGVYKLLINVADMIFEIMRHLSMFQALIV